MHKHQSLDQYDQTEFDRLYNLYEDCDGEARYGEVDGLDRRELTRLFMRVAKI